MYSQPARWAQAHFGQGVQKSNAGGIGPLQLYLRPEVLEESWRGCLLQIPKFEANSHGLSASALVRDKYNEQMATRFK